MSSNVGDHTFVVLHNRRRLLQNRESNSNLKSTQIQVDAHDAVESSQITICFEISTVLNIVSRTLSLTEQDHVTLNWNIPEHEQVNNDDERQMHHVLGLLSVGNVNPRVIEGTTRVITSHHLLEIRLGSTTLSVKLRSFHGLQFDGQRSGVCAFEAHFLLAEVRFLL